LKHVVDEGVEEAGKNGMIAMAKQEEKEWHEEMPSRIRNRYDGRRGGIAGGGIGARGMHHFNQLMCGRVAADNREDAVLDFFNGDELDSDDEGEEKEYMDNGDQEIENEAASPKRKLLQIVSVTMLVQVNRQAASLPLLRMSLHVFSF
jgi:hypothetical protein